MNVFVEPEDHASAAVLAKVLNKGIELLGQTDRIDVEIDFLSKDEIRELNAAERDKDEVTDVLSFPALDEIRGKILNPKDYLLDLDPETGNIMLGSIAICTDRAVEQSEEYGHSVEREICYLGIHGLLHLLGYDHMTDEDKLQMRELEERILNALNITR